MSTMAHTEQLVALAEALAGTDETARVVVVALPGLREIAGAAAAEIVSAEERSLTDLGPTLTEVAVPDDWRDQGIVRALGARLPEHAGVLLLGWVREDDDVDTSGPLELAVALVAATVRRAAAGEHLADLSSRVDNAQHLANMGDYDWHIPSDTNRWSDQLFRIYGHEPQSFNASYESFLALVHPEDRERIQALHQQAYGSGEPWQVVERIVRPDGEVRHLLTNGEVVMGHDGVPVRMRGTCIDITERVHAEAENAKIAARLGEAHLRRRQALEINDNVVQGLVAAAYALDQGQVTMSQAYLDQTLSAARAMMDDLLEPLDGQGLQPGDLVRTTAASFGNPAETAPAAEEDGIDRQQSHRVLVVDDAQDLRMLLRARMETRDGLTVVGEAADGLAAVELASELQPDLVMLDLAMPRMDGLEALPLIRAAVPGVRIIVLSGFNQSTLAQKALAAGADKYVVKGGSMRQLLELVDAVLDAAAS
jgi:PAS domain S-box-containing protein